MLYEIAITPGILEASGFETDSSVPRDLVRLFEGIRQNCLVADLCNGELRRALGKKVQELPQGPVRDEFRAYLEQIDRRGRFVTREYKGSVWPEDDESWYEEARASHGENPFHCIVTTQTTLEAKAPLDSAISLGSLLTAPKWNSRPSSKRIPRRAEDFCATLRSILTCSKSLLLVDPHINCGERRYGRALRMMSEVVFSRARPVELVLFELHLKPPASDVGTIERYKGDITRCLQPAVPRGQQINVVLWEEQTMKFHNRFLLSNFCGVSIDTGFDEVSGNTDYDDWQLLEEEHRSDLWRIFAQPAYAVHRKIGAFSIAGG